MVIGDSRLPNLLCRNLILIINRKYIVQSLNVLVLRAFISLAFKTFNTIAVLQSGMVL